MLSELSQAVPKDYSRHPRSVQIISPESLRQKVKEEARNLLESK
jgi:hypothetical protein